MPRFTIKRYEQILMQMIAKVVTRTALSDISDTSVMKHLLAAAARQDDEQYYQMLLLLDLFSIDKACGDDLDERAQEIMPALITRNAAVKASGNLIFSRNSVSGTVTIPTGTEVMTASGQHFVTTAPGSITPSSPALIPGHGVGQDSARIPAVAVTAGSAGNVAVGTVIKFAQKPAGVDMVTNLESFLYGADLESDDSFRARLKKFVASLSRSTPMSLESALLGAVDLVTGAVIQFATVVEDEIDRGNVLVYVDDGTGSAESSEAVTGEIMTEDLAGPPAGSAVGGETILFLQNCPVKEDADLTLTSSIRGELVDGTDYYVNPASGQVNFVTALVASEVITADYTYYTGIIQAAQKIIDGDPADPVNYPGYRAAGVLVRVRTPQVVVPSVTVTVVVLDGYDHTEVKSTVKQAIKEYVNSLGISGDVIMSEIIKRVMSVDGLYNVYLTEPTNDMYLLENQIARITDGDIIVN